MTIKVKSLVSLARQDNDVDWPEVQAEIERQDKRYRRIEHQRRMNALREHGDRVRIDVRSSDGKREP